MLSGCLKEKINVIRQLENFLRDFEKKVLTFFEPKVVVNLENFSPLTKTFCSKNAETFFSKSLKIFSNGRMTLIFSFRHPLNLIV